MRSEICYGGKGVSDGTKFTEKLQGRRDVATCGKAASRPSSAELCRMEEIMGFEESLLQST